MTTINTAATETVETMRPLIEAAITSADEKRLDALARLDRNNMRGRLLAAIGDAQDTADAATVQQFAAMLPAHRVSESNYLPRMLLAVRRENRITDEQATTIARALLALIRGKVPAGLMQVDEDWHSAFNVRDLEQLAEWLHPEAVAALRQGWDVAALDFASASYELNRLEKMREGVELLSVPAYKAQATVKVRNTSNRAFKIVGQPFEPGHATSLEREQLAALLATEPMRQSFESGALEVIR